MCRECGKPRCGCHENPCGLSPSVLQINNPRGCVLFEAVDIPASAGDDSEGSPYAPVNGRFKNTLVTYEANGNMYFYTSSGAFRKISSIGDLSKYATIKYSDEKDAETLEKAKAYTDGLISAEATSREEADNNLQEQIDAIVASSDVVDIVGTYDELQAYDTSKLGDNDIVKVLSDSTHDDAISYYRWDKDNSTWEYVGSEGPYYTKAETDNLLNGKQDTLTPGSHITIAQDGTISATGMTREEILQTLGYTEIELSKTDANDNVVTVHVLGRVG